MAEPEPGFDAILTRLRDVVHQLESGELSLELDALLVDRERLLE